MTATLARQQSTDQGTPGRLYLAGAFFAHTLELPWRDNKPFVSCIPTGVYLVDWLPSFAFGYSYRLAEVRDRSAILFHAGNVAGDTSLGLRADSLGCILLGFRAGVLDGQSAVLSSGTAVARLAARLNRESFFLSIV